MSYVKTVLFVSLLSLISAKKRHGHMHTCTSDKQCRSQSCVSLCGSSEKSCTEPRWFFERHGMGAPDCVDRDAEGTIRYRGLQDKDNRELGETCAVPMNCKSGNCIPRCENWTRGEWQCVQEKGFWLSHGVANPVCMHKDLFELGVILMNADHNNSKDVEVTVDAIKRSMARYAMERGNDVENRAQVDLFRRAVIDREFIEADNEVNDRHEVQMERKDHSDEDLIKNNEVDERHEEQMERKHEEQMERKADNEDHESEDLTKTSFNEDDRREAEIKEVEKKSDNFIQEPGFQHDVPAYFKDNEVDERHEAQAERKADSEDHDNEAQAERKTDSESYDSEDLTKMSVEEDDRREAELKIEKKIDSGVGQEPDLELNVPAYLRQGVKEELKGELKAEEEGSTSE